MNCSLAFSDLILSRVAEYLIVDCRDVARFVHVSKHFMAAVKNTELWAEFNAEDILKHPILHNIVRRAYICDSQKVHEILSKNKITELTIDYHLTPISQNTIRGLTATSKFRQLKSITILHFTDINIVINNFPNLEYLQLLGSNAFIIGNLPKLRNLHLDTYIYEHSVAYIKAKDVPALETLHIHMDIATPDFDIGQLPNIKRVNARGKRFKSFPVGALSVIAAGFEMPIPQESMVEYLDLIDNNNQLPPLQNLVWLNARIIGILPSMPRLKYIGGDCMNLISIEPQPALKKLDIHNFCGKLPDAPNLTEVIVCGSRIDVRDLGKCPKLKYICARDSLIFTDGKIPESITVEYVYTD